MGALKQPAKQLLHVIAIPYPAQGHITPLLQLCEQLVPFGFTFTFINTHHIHQRLQRSSDILSAAQPDTTHLNDDIAHRAYAVRVHNGWHAAQVQLKEKVVNNLHHILHSATYHNGKSADANDVDCYVPSYHACNGDAPHAQEIYHYKGCSSIKMVYVAGGCPPEKLARISTAHEAFRAAQEMCEPVENLLSCIMEKQAIDFIMSDVVLGWSSATACKFGLPWVSFWPASAACLSSFIHFSDLSNRGETSIPIAEMEAGRPFLIPGLPPTHLSDVPKIWDAQGKLHEGLLSFFKPLHHASLLLLNTFEELEGPVLQVLSTRFPIRAIGPLVPFRYLLHTCPDMIQQEAPLCRPTLFPEDYRCLAWLDTQPPSSVLFISFGSISLRSTAQLQELAKGVEASGCPFLWVCKPDISNELDKTHKHGSPPHKNGSPPHGLIVSWAPQLQVLSHPSIGGFITHCGWNSLIESVSMGVPMLCWADTTERMSNQRFVVDFWKCGVHMVSDMRRAKQNIDEAVLIGQDDVEKSIRFLMFEDGGASIRMQATKLKGTAMKAFQDSHVLLKEFAKTMKQECLSLVQRQSVKNGFTTVT